MSDRFTMLREQLEARGQAHVLRFHDELDEPRRAALLDQVEQIDWVALDGMIRERVLVSSEETAPEAIEPAPYYGRDARSSALPYDAEAMRDSGRDLIRAGRLAAFTVAGGQGTRLGWNGPKGTYPATVVTGKPLFRCFAEQILAAERKYRITIPWYIMTSPLNDEATRAFFLDNNCFGLARKNIFMFPQGLVPSLEPGTGKVLLEDRDRIALNPDGHGGAIKALRTSGAVEDMLARGVEHISYFQVDNPLVRVIDPLFVGLHATAPGSSAEMSSKMVPKEYPDEKMGVFVRVGGDGPTAGRTMVIEYSDLPESLARQADDDGRLRFIAGSIAVHLISVDLIQRLTADPAHFALPWHVARKKVACLDPASGERVDPDEPNALKLEAFVFDALPLVESSIVYETERVDEFAPIKNADGVDSPATSHRLQSDRSGRWLEQHDVRVPRDDDGHVDARIEISPLTALDPDDLSALPLPEAIEAGAELVL